MTLPQNLQYFIQDFLEAVAADGRLGAPEETPLLAAFHAYGVHRLLADAREETEAALRSAAARSARGGVRLRTRDELEAVWQRLLEVSGGLTLGELLAVRNWLADEAAVQGVEFTRPHPGDECLCAGAVCRDAGVLAWFQQWVLEAAAAVESAVPAPPQPAEPPAPMPQATPAPVPTVTVRDGVLERSAWDEIVAAVKRRRRVLERGEAVLSRIEAQRPAMLFDADRNAGTGRVVVVREMDERVPLWFVGDLHGDSLAFEAAVRYIRTESGGTPPRIVFLGDLVDDLDYSLDVVLGVWELIGTDAASVCVLAGNHDEGLTSTAEGFTSLVQPAEFADSLNAATGSLERRTGRLLIEFMRAMPRALFLPDGLLAVHGGFPLKDTWERLVALQDLDASQCLQDFVWTRASESARTKIPNRSSKGCQFGYQDFEGFCEVASRLLGRPVCRMVRGHDHVADRFLLYTRYRRAPMLTINTLCRRLNREVFGEFVRKPCVARWVRGALPEVHRIDVPESVVRSVYPEPDGDVA